MPEDLCQIAALAPEDVEISGKGIALQALLHLPRQPLHATPHIGVALCDPDSNTARNGDHRRDRAFNTRVSAAVSTSDHTRIRSPSASTISIWPSNPGADASATVSGMIVTGRIDPECRGSAGSMPNCRRQVKSWLALRSCRRATSASEAPSSRLSSTIRRFSSSVQGPPLPLR